MCQPMRQSFSDICRTVASHNSWRSQIARLLMSYGSGASDRPVVHLDGMPELVSSLDSDSVLQGHKAPVSFSLYLSLGMHTYVYRCLRGMGQRLQEDTLDFDAMPEQSRLIIVGKLRNLALCCPAG